MRLILHLEGAGEQRPVTRDRFTIGRAQENDWVLPDPEQRLSRQHCVIERRGEAFCVVDTSSNGVFVNAESAPLGRGHERSLADGDHLRLGTYAIRVEFEGASASEPLQARGKLFDPTHVPKAAPKQDAGAVFDYTWVGRSELGPADHRVSPTAKPDLRFQTPPEHRPVDLGKIAPEPELFDTPKPTAPISGPPADTSAGSLFDSTEPDEAPVESAPPTAEPDELDLLDPFAAAVPVEAPAAPPSPAPRSAPSPTPATRVEAPVAQPPPAAQPAPSSTPAAPAVPPAPAAAAEQSGQAADVLDIRLIEAFLAGAGLDADALAIDDPEAFMRAAGARLRDMTEGLVQLLNARASVKNVARVERTTIGRDHNNPLKYSVTPEEALMAVLQARGPGFLPPEAAVRGGFRDIQEHEMALLDAMQVALRALLQRFEPGSFEKQLEAENLFSTLVAGGRRAKCWDAFKARYAQIASEAERAFLGDVGADFSRGYEVRMRRM
jgi:type VI secretion system FHA domain protein